jgi:hypothetical protein
MYCPGLAAPSTVDGKYLIRQSTRHVGNMLDFSVRVSNKEVSSFTERVFLDNPDIASRGARGNFELDLLPWNDVNSCFGFFKVKYLLVSILVHCACQ